MEEKDAKPTTCSRDKSRISTRTNPRAISIILKSKRPEFLVSRGLRGNAKVSLERGVRRPIAHNRATPATVPSFSLRAILPFYRHAVGRDVS